MKGADIENHYNTKSSFRGAFGKLTTTGYAGTEDSRHDDEQSRQ